MNIDFHNTVKSIEKISKRRDNPGEGRSCERKRAPRL
jgi:hypothetical protein